MTAKLAEVKRENMTDRLAQRSHNRTTRVMATIAPVISALSAFGTLWIAFAKPNAGQAREAKL